MAGGGKVDTASLRAVLLAAPNADGLKQLLAEVLIAGDPFEIGLLHRPNSQPTIPGCMLQRTNITGPEHTAPQEAQIATGCTDSEGTIYEVRAGHSSALEAALNPKPQTPKLLHAQRVEALQDELEDCAQVFWRWRLGLGVSGL